MKYVKEDVENMLKQHKKNEAKILELELKIEEYSSRLEYAGTVYEESDRDIIESMQLSAKVSEVPSGKTNKTSNVTENTAINYQKEKVHVNREDRSFLEYKLKEFETTKEKLNKQAVRVRNMLNQLTTEEKFIMEKYYMEKSKWDYVEKKYFEEFEIHKTIKQLQRYKDVALNSMLEILNIGMS